MQSFDVTDGQIKDIIKCILKAEAHGYGKGRYISHECLQCSANHNALPIGQSEQTALVGRRDFVEN